MNHRQQEKRAKRNFQRLFTIIYYSLHGARVKPSRVKLKRQQLTENVYVIKATAAGHTMTLDLKEKGAANGSKAS